MIEIIEDNLKVRFIRINKFGGGIYVGYKLTKDGKWRTQNILIVNQLLRH